MGVGSFFSIPNNDFDKYMSHVRYVYNGLNQSIISFFNLFVSCQRYTIFAFLGNVKRGFT